MNNAALRPAPYVLTLFQVQSHVPGYVNDYDKLKQAGAEVIACVSVNDAFVMKAWGDSTGATGKVSLNCFTAMNFYTLRCRSSG